MITLADIAPAFSFVFAKGLLPSASDYSPHACSNAWLVMAGSPFSLRFERDRGEVFVDVGNDSAGWHKLEYALEFVDNTVKQENLGEPPNPEVLAILLHPLWDRVADLFNNQRALMQLREFTEQKTSALLGKIFLKP